MHLPSDITIVSKYLKLLISNISITLVFYFVFLWVLNIWPWNFMNTKCLTALEISERGRGGCIWASQRPNYVGGVESQRQLSIVASGSDDQVTIWDVSLERDETPDNEDEPDVPPQLLFIHMGQNDIKEVHWQPQIPGVLFSTAQNGFNVFRPLSVWRMCIRLF